MKSITFKIVKLKKSTTALIVIGSTLTFLGVLLAFTLDDDIKHRPYHIGIPLIIGMTTLLALKIISPTEVIGQFSINPDSIEIQRTDFSLKLNYTDIENIRLIIIGYEMELNRNWWILSREFFPFNHGHSNKVIITNKDKTKTNSRFFLKSKPDENRLIETLTNTSKDYNFSLTLSLPPSSNH